jgi:uncharacterized protein with NRDE domain
MNKYTKEIYHYKGFDFLNSERVSIYYKPNQPEPIADKSKISRIIKHLKLQETLSWYRKLLKKITR